MSESTDGFGEQPWRDPDILERLYWGEGRTIREIADELGCSRHAISYNMDKHGMETRKNSHQKPCHYRTQGRDGYEVWNTGHGGDQWTVRVHRLLAVSMFGFDAVADKDVHHRNGVPWDNRPENLEVVEHGDHTSMHLSERVDEMQFDENGNIAGWDDARE